MYESQKELPSIGIKTDLRDNSFVFISHYERLLDMLRVVRGKYDGNVLNYLADASMKQVEIPLVDRIILELIDHGYFRNLKV